MHQEFHKDDLIISTDPSRLDIRAIHAFLSKSYWAEGIPREIVARSIRHSLCFGVYDGSSQIGFAGVISDFATYVYIADVYVVDSRRGKGVGRWLMSCIVSHPDLQGASSHATFTDSIRSSDLHS